MPDKGLSVSVILPGRCNLQVALADVRERLGPTLGGSTYRLVVICRTCGAGWDEQGTREHHAPDCPTACDDCPRAAD